MEPIEVQLSATWESIHPTCKRIPREAFQNYAGAVSVEREGDGVVVSVSVEGNDLLTLRLNVEQATALVEQIQA